MKTNGVWTGLVWYIVLAGCGNGETVAVLDIADSGASLSAAALEQLAEHLAGKIGEGGDLHVLPRNTDAAGADVDYVLETRILRPGDRCCLVLRLYRHQGRATIRSTSVQTNCDADGLLDAIDVAVFRLGSLGALPPRVEPPQIVLEKRQAVVAKEPPAEAPAEPALVPAPIAPSPRPAMPAAKAVAVKPTAKVDRPPQKPSPGYLSVHTRPWSEVHIDGRKAGYTPIIKHELPAGRHALTLLSADGHRKDIRIDIQPGKVRKVLHRFEKGSATLNGGLAVEQQQGTLLINSSPWSRVSVDGQFVGITPLLGVKLPVGPHTVVLETTGGLKKEFAVIIEAGTQRKIIADLNPPQATRPPLEPPPDPAPRLQSSNGH